MVFCPYPLSILLHPAPYFCLLIFDFDFSHVVSFHHFL